jgi:hypothetical protein
MNAPGTSLNTTLLAILLIIVRAATTFADDPIAGGQSQAGPRAIATFHCLGLYWSPPGGAAEKQLLIRYRRQGDQSWKEGLPMRYNPIAITDLDLTDYRGSIVHLSPGTTYEIELTLTGTSTKATLTAATWREEFPVGHAVHVESGDRPLAITESGTPDGYRLYDGRNATIDVRHQHDNCVTIDASYVIVRGLKLRGAGDAKNTSSKPIGAVLIKGGHDIVIEDCNISDWGRLDPQRGFGFDYESAIYSRAAALERLVIQRCKLHDPTFDGSSWYEPKYPTHSEGPQCISLFNAGGNHVIRYNECWSDMDHMFNDIIGGGSNGSYRGSPGPDSDIYGNFVSHCWDDGLEVEGGSRNVRVWDNYITQSMMMIGNAACSIGPLYIWRNVCARSQSQPGAGGGNFLKMGFADGDHWMTGHMYIFHNTVFRSDEWLPTGGLGGNRLVKHTVSRNNILHVRSPQNYSASGNRQNVDIDFDYDLMNGRFPSEQEKHGVQGEPVYASGAGLDAMTKAGSFQLVPTSPGAGVGEAIPNFSSQFEGSAPDMGAHQRGAPLLRYGVQARQR